MSKQRMKYIFFTGILMTLCVQPTNAGPPFVTDDPEPVGYRHWEYYISTFNTFGTNNSTGIIPNVEVNYGLVPNVQVHIILPLNYIYSSQRGFRSGYANTELGLKYRFVQEDENIPQIGTFPIIEIPTINNSEFGSGHIQLFLPVWAQKSWGKLTTYGGAGYWINPGITNYNWFFTGVEMQYDLSPVLTLGGEIYYHTKDSYQSKSSLGFNAGGSFNTSKKFHIIFSAGHSLINDSFITTYLGLLWTI